jgi:hypothetical protein
MEGEKSEVLVKRGELPAAVALWLMSFKQFHSTSM